MTVASSFEHEYLRKEPEHCTSSRRGVVIGTGSSFVELQMQTISNPSRVDCVTATGLEDALIYGEEGAKSAEPSSTTTRANKSAREMRASSSDIVMRKCVKTSMNSSEGRVVIATGKVCIEVSESSREDYLKTCLEGSKGMTDTSNPVVSKGCESVRVRKVSFNHVALRTYSKTFLGDNPSARGVAIALGGIFVESDPIPLDEYEWKRGERRRQRDLILSEVERKERLLASGYRNKEIQRALVELKKYKLQRDRTKRDLYKSGREEAMEAIFSKLKKVVARRKQCKHELQLQAYIEAAKTA